MGLEAEATQWGEPVTNPQPKHFEDLVFKNVHSNLCIHLQYSMFLLPECQVLLLCGIWWRFTDMHNVFLVSVLWRTRIWQHLSCLDAYKRTHGLTHLVSIILWCAWFLPLKGAYFKTSNMRWFPATLHWGWKWRKKQVWCNPKPLSTLSLCR